MLRGKRIGVGNSRGDLNFSLICGGCCKGGWFLAPVLSYIYRDI